MIKICFENDLFFFLQDLPVKDSKFLTCECYFFDDRYGDILFYGDEFELKYEDGKWVDVDTVRKYYDDMFVDCSKIELLPAPF